MNHTVRIVRGPNGMMLEDDRSPRRVEADRNRLRVLTNRLEQLLPATDTEASTETKTAAFNHIHEIFTTFANGDGRPHKMGESSTLSPEEKKFLILAASRSNEFFITLTQGDWGHAMALLIEVGKTVKLSTEQEALRSSIVMKLGLLCNGIEDDTTATVAGTFNTEAEALAA